MDGARIDSSKMISTLRHRKYGALEASDTAARPCSYFSMRQILQAKGISRDAARLTMRNQWVFETAHAADFLHPLDHGIGTFGLFTILRSWLTESCPCP
jgi:hypothetical protein